jgi:hypothetical protein
MRPLSEFFQSARDTNADGRREVECWDFKNCQPEVRESCPAYTRQMGHDCWKITGTMCAAGVLRLATLGEKIQHCRHCEFYLKYAHKY